MVTYSLTIPELCLVFGLGAVSMLVAIIMQAAVSSRARDVARGDGIAVLKRRQGLAGESPVGGRKA